MAGKDRARRTNALIFGIMAEILWTPALLLSSWGSESAEFATFGRSASTGVVIAAMALVAVGLPALFFADRINRALLLMLMVLLGVAIGGVGVIALTELETLWLSLIGCGFAVALTTGVVRASVRSPSGMTG